MLGNSVENVYVCQFAQQSVGWSAAALHIVASLQHSNNAALIQLFGLIEKLLHCTNSPETIEVQAARGLQDSLARAALRDPTRGRK